jgi:hypothetical protein
MVVREDHNLRHQEKGMYGIVTVNNSLLTNYLKLSLERGRVHKIPRKSKRKKEKNGVI